MDGGISSQQSREGHHIYLWHGSLDSVVPPPNAINSYNFLAQLLPPSASIRLDNDIPANHGISSFNYGSECGLKENRESFGTVQCFNREPNAKPLVWPSSSSRNADKN